MKKAKFLVVLIFALAFAGCKDGSGNTSKPLTLQGKWYRGPETLTLSGNTFWFYSSLAPGAWNMRGTFTYTEDTFTFNFTSGVCEFIPYCTWSQKYTLYEATIISTGENVHVLKFEWGTSTNEDIEFGGSLFFNKPTTWY